MCCATNANYSLSTSDIRWKGSMDDSTSGEEFIQSGSPYYFEQTSMPLYGGGRSSFLDSGNGCSYGRLQWPDQPPGDQRSMLAKSQSLLLQTCYRWRPWLPRLRQMPPKHPAPSRTQHHWPHVRQLREPQPRYQLAWLMLSPRPCRHFACPPRVDADSEV